MKTKACKWCNGAGKVSVFDEFGIIFGCFCYLFISKHVQCSKCFGSGERF